MKKHRYGCIKVASVCLLLLSLILAVQTQAAMAWTVESAAMTWTIETVDWDSSGIGASLKLDSSGNPYISYYGGDSLKYAKWNGSTWNIETVDDALVFGWYCPSSLALDSGNNPHISYQPRSGGYCYLRYAEWNGSTWKIENVAVTGGPYDKYASPVYSSSLALDSGGNPHISYFDDNANCLKYAKWNGSTWNIETVDSSGGIDVSIALGPSGYPHISYRTGWYVGALKYAKWNGSGWNIETVDSGEGTCSSIVLDSDECPHISYYSSGNLKYAVWNGSGWKNEIIDSVGDFNPDDLYCSLALDSSDNPYISYIFSGNLKYASWNGLVWSNETIVSSVRDNSIAVDSSGNPHISYFDRSNGGMKLNYASGVEKISSRVSVSTISSSMFAGFRVNVTGTLRDAYGNGLKDAEIVLSYTFSGAGTWTPITSCTTDNAGDFFATWIPTATGSFTLNASWSGNATHSPTSSTTTLNCLSYNQYVFSVDSNSTISGLAFNVNDQTLSFMATGADGTEGYVKATVAKNFTANPEGVKVLIDDTQVACSPTSTSDSCLIYFTYQHSTHSVTIDLSAAAQPTPTPTPSSTATPTSTSTPSPTPMPSSTPAATPTPTPTATLPAEIIYSIAAVAIAAIAAAAVIIFYLRKRK